MRDYRLMTRSANTDSDNSHPKNAAECTPVRKQPCMYSGTTFAGLLVLVLWLPAATGNGTMTPKRAPEAGQGQVPRKWSAPLCLEPGWLLDIAGASTECTTC
jgi:hypothetical protein